LQGISAAAIISAFRTSGFFIILFFTLSNPPSYNSELILNEIMLFCEFDGGLDLL